MPYTFLIDKLSKSQKDSDISLFRDLKSIAIDIKREFPDMHFSEIYDEMCIYILSIKEIKENSYRKGNRLLHKICGYTCNEEDLYTFKRYLKKEAHNNKTGYPAEDWENAKRVQARKIINTLIVEKSLKK